MTSTTIPMSWTSAGSVVDSYEVMWTVGPGDCPGVSGDSATVDGDTTSYTIEGLEEYITYTITVTATNAVGSAVSDQATQRTSEAGKTIIQVYEIHCNPYVLCVSHALCSSFWSSHFSQCYWYIHHHRCPVGGSGLHPPQWRHNRLLSAVWGTGE